MVTYFARESAKVKMLPLSKNNCRWQFKWLLGVGQARLIVWEPAPSSEVFFMRIRLCNIYKTFCSERFSTNAADCIGFVIILFLSVNQIISCRVQIKFGLIYHREKFNLWTCQQDLMYLVAQVCSRTMSCPPSLTPSGLLAISGTTKKNVFLCNLLVRMNKIFWCNCGTSFNHLSVYEVKTAILEKWRAAGQLFSSSSPLLINDKAIVALLTRTFASALDCITERGRKVTRERFLLKSGGLLNILKCKWVVCF